MTTRNDPAGKISWRQAVFSILVLGTFLAFSFGGGVLKHGQRYRFLGQELYAEILAGDRYHLSKEYHFINNHHEPRRLFIVEKAGSLVSHRRLILTDENYQAINRIEFLTSGTCNKVSLVQTVNPPLLEMLSFTDNGMECLHFTINEDHFLQLKPKRDLYQTASLAR